MGKMQAFTTFYCARCQTGTQHRITLARRTAEAGVMQVSAVCGQCGRRDGFVMSERQLRELINGHGA
jgi:RNase P subunit RPR2